LAVWIALGERPGIGTVCNVVLVGLALDVTLDLLPTPAAMPIRASFLLGGVLLNAVATSLYIGARLGPGPRDGLMTAFAARGHSIRVARTVIELAVLGVGAVLGGQVGPGTLLYAFAVGPLVQFLLPRFDVGTTSNRTPDQTARARPRGGSSEHTTAVRPRSLDIDAPGNPTGGPTGAACAAGRSGRV
jgi:uncharacterized membrane protein YczE